MKTLVIIFALALCLCNSQAPGGYSQVPNAEVQNSTLIQSLAQYGANLTVQAANNAGNLPNGDTNFTIANINSVYQQVVNGINYWFNATLTNPDNSLTLNAFYIVYYQPSTQAQRIVSASYNIPPHAPIPSIGSSGSNLPGGYTLIPEDQVQNSSAIQSLASFGAQNIIQQVIATKKLPTANTDFSIANINSVSQQVVNGTNYRFDVTLNNSDGVLVNGIYVINYQAATNFTSILSTSYVINSYTAPAGRPILTTTTQTASAANATASASGNISAPAANITNNTSAAVVTQNPTSQLAAANPSSVLGGYTPLSSSDIQGNPAIQNLAALGAQGVTQQAIADGNAPSNSVFTIAKINKVGAQVVNGINYNINALLSNADNSTTILADYVVYYQAWTNTSRVLASVYVVVPK